MDDDGRWYPRYEDYYVDNPNAEEFPVRQGDLLAAPTELAQRDSDPWLACQVVHPSCEIVAKKNPTLLHVVRIYPLGVKDTPKDQQAVVEGYSIVDGLARIEFAHTFFLPPGGSADAPMFSDFRELVAIPRTDVTVDRRIAALTHDTRVYFIRRKLHWEQRWMLKLQEVKALESMRISKDPNFVGPRPQWAT